MSRLKLNLWVGLICVGMTMVAHGARSPAQQQLTAAPNSAVIMQSGSMTLDRAVALVEAKYKAKVMRANTVEEDGRAIHYIRLITADRSRVFTVRVDAATGREL